MLASILKSTLPNTHDVFPNKRDGVVSVDRVPVVRIIAPNPDEISLKWNTSEAGKLFINRDTVRKAFDEKHGTFRGAVEWEA